MKNNCKYWNAEHGDCALSCEEIRNNAIDKFVEQLKEYKYGRTNGVYIEIPLYKLNEIAEEMKAGGDNVEYEDDVKKHERCENCKYRHIVRTNAAFQFYGCYHRPYTGKWVTEIKDCPKGSAKRGG